MSQITPKLQSFPSGCAGNSLPKVLATLAVAALILVTIVLPAEYGIDPTGIGKLLRLTDISQPAQRSKDFKVGDPIAGNSNLEALIPAGGDEPIPLPNPGVFQEQASSAQHNVFDITLQPGEQTEIKMMLDANKVGIFSWNVSGGTVYVDFHGHKPDNDAFWVRYEEQDGARQSYGSLVAPFAGEHGWYWLNLGDNPVTIHLQLDGFYNEIVDYGITGNEPF